MKKYLLTFVILFNLIFSQQPSYWRVYISPYKANGQYIRANNTTTGIPMAWWKKHLTYYVESNVPLVVEEGINYAMYSSTSWGSVYSTSGLKLFNFSKGNSNNYDIKIKMDNNLDYGKWSRVYGYGYLTRYDSTTGTGQIYKGLIGLNGRSVGIQGDYYDIIYSLNHGYEITTPDYKVYMDPRPLVAHELGHVLGLAHPYGDGGYPGHPEQLIQYHTNETMCTSEQAISAYNRMYIKDGDIEALKFVYDKPLVGVYVNGPTNQGHNQNATFGCSSVGGRKTLTYQWEIRYSPATRGMGIRSAPSNQWVSIGTNSQTLVKGYNSTDLRNYEIRCTVRDLNNKSVVSNIHSVTVGSGYGASTTNLENDNPEMKKMEIEDLQYTLDLEQNYPNPFNPTTNINFAIDEDGEVSVKIYDIQGKEIATLLDGYKQAGKYSVKFDGSNLASGIYFYKLQTNNKVISKKMLLAK